MIEPLESRRLRSATITEGYPGFYEITGDDSVDVIQISIDQDAGTMTYDGNTYTDVNSVSIHGEGGNDTLNVTNSGTGPISVAITGDDGNDFITLGCSGAVWGGNGNDKIYINDSFMGEGYGEAGDDEIHVSGNTADPEIQGGDGNDLLDAASNNYAVKMFGGNGNDRLYGSDYDDTLYGDDGEDYYYGNDGNDTFYTQDGYTDYLFGDAGDHDLAHVDIEEGWISGIEHVTFV
jgi:Ca2+-binding RTX toxin-like protein